MDLFEEPGPTRISLPDADLLLYPSIGLTDKQAMLSRLIAETPWQQSLDWAAGWAVDREKRFGDARATLLRRTRPTEG